ncbi:hypothetical protein K2X05_07425 [bacterium]|nr:hypothetical protein [bacterium]
MFLHHSLYQRYGISNILVRSSTPVGKENIEQSLRGERFLVNVILFLTIVSTLIFWIRGEWGLQLESLRDVKLRKSVGILLLLQIIIISFYILFETFSYKNNQKRVVQLLRYYLYPMSFVSFVGALLSRVFHAFEYLWIFRLLTRSEERKIGTFLFYFLIISAALVPVLVNAGQRLICFEQDGGCNVWLFSVVKGLVVSISAMHMYLDRVSFNFKYPAVQKNLIPLLNKTIE